MLNIFKKQWTANSVTLSAVLFALSPVPLSANALEEIIVTAQKREQSIQDVGIAITAFSRRAD